MSIRDFFLESDLCRRLIRLLRCQLNPILLGQSRTQGILRNHLRRLGREVELAKELVDIEQNADYVTCRLKKTKEDGSAEDEILKVDYVVGVDGGRG